MYLPGIHKAIKRQALFFSSVLVAIYFALVLLPFAHCVVKTSWFFLAYAIILGVLLISKNWERNSYAVITAWIGILLSVAACFIDSKLMMILWLFDMIAFISTVTIPIEMRMPLVLYFIFYYLINPNLTLSPLVLTCISIVFLSGMFILVRIWSANNWQTVTKSDIIPTGPSEPPFSTSLAIAILLAVFLPLCSSVLEALNAPKVVVIIKDCMTIGICAWVAFSPDWRKNTLAFGALWLIIASNIISIGLSLGIAKGAWIEIGYYMALSPVMFHTTAPVHRAIRITITLYATFSALLLKSLTIDGGILFHGLVFIALLPMTWHWMRTRRI